MAQFTAAADPDATEITRCTCGNIRVVRSPENGSVAEERDTSNGQASKVLVKEQDILIRYDELSLWKPHRPPPSETTPRRRDSSSSSRSPVRRASVGSRKGDTQVGKGTLSCLVCGEDVVRSIPEGEVGSQELEVTKMSENTSPSHPSTSKLLNLTLPSKPEPSTFGAPSRPPTPTPPTTYLPPLPDPFFLPPPFTPSHTYFDKLARHASSYITESRARVEQEIKTLIQQKRRQVETEESEIRGEVEFLWKAFEAGQRAIGIDPSREDLDAGRTTVIGGARQAITGPSAAFSPNGNAARTSFGAGTTPRPEIENPSPGMTFGGAGSLLSTSLSTHGFFPQSKSETKEPASTPMSPTASASRSAAGPTTKPTFEQNSITMPYQQRKSGIDLDIAASLRVSNMADLYQQSTTADGSVTNRHNRPDTRDRRYYDPGADVEDLIPSVRADRSPSLGRREKVEREGGKGDIELQPFAESSQVSAASSYQGEHGVSGSVRAAEDAREREEEQLRTPRGRAVKPIGESISPAQLTVPSKLRNANDSPSPAVTLRSNDKQGTGGAQTSPKASGEGPASKRKIVTFKEPSVERVASPTKVLEIPEQEEDELLPSEPEDAVFDFEEHDTPVDIPEPGIASQLPVPLEGSTPDAAKVEAMRRNTELVENKLIDMVAADAPSHRAAWRNNKDQLWQALGRYQSRPFGTASVPKRKGSNEDLSQDQDDSPSTWGTTLLGTSAPIQIQRPEPTSANYALEPKTSLVERQGVMVPSLRPMRRGSSSSGSVIPSRASSGSRPPSHHDLPADVVSEDAHNLPGSNSSSDIRRRASAGHATGDKKEQTAAGNPTYSHNDKRMSFAMDPGPALEALGSPNDGGDEDDEDDVPGGANFVPPHRQTSQDRDPDGMGEAGWRSLA